MNKDKLFQYIADNVSEINFTQDFEDVYGDRIWRAYLDECEVRGKKISPKEFVEDMYDSIAWDWVYKND